MEYWKSLYEAFVFSTYVDSLSIASRMHSFSIAYQYLRAMW